MVNKTNFQDYHKFSWYVPASPFTFTSFLKTRLLYILPSLVISFFLSKRLAYIQNIINQTELRIFFFIIIVITLLIIVILDYFISKSSGRKITHYSISKEGISINQKVLSFNHLKLNNSIDIKALKKKGFHYLLKIPSKSSIIRLKFTTKNEAEKFLQAFDKYAR